MGRKIELYILVPVGVRNCKPGTYSRYMPLLSNEKNDSAQRVLSKGINMSGRFMYTIFLTVTIESENVK